MFPTLDQAFCQPSAPPLPSVEQQEVPPSMDALESQDFYEVCQAYRHSLLGGLEFEALKEWIRKNASVKAEVTDPQYPK